ncbi:MAG: squalene/phytoene synthase family protein, partial [Gemmatimonadota bacterium]
GCLRAGDQPHRAGAAGAGRDSATALWRALAAVQLAHEASLVHDDVVDGAAERRGRPTLVASRGVAAALVEGDHLLTAAYRLAAATGSVDWFDLFARAVERTVAGEKEQARSAGRVLSWPEYEAIVGGKSGELVGAAFAAAATLRGAWDVHRYEEVGRGIGVVYQMLDDLLDYCPHVPTGKPPLLDYQRGLWTWPRAYVELEDGLDAVEVGRRLRERDAAGRSPLDRALERLREEVAEVSREAAGLLPGDPIVGALLDEWLRTAEEAVLPVGVELPPVGGWERLMEEHAKSFRFASRLFPAGRREQVTGVYAWCRYTDNLVDGVDLPAAELEARLDAWLELSRRAYEGAETGNALADRVMGGMRAAGVPFGYAAELIEGMRMDVRGREYRTLEELRSYTFRVASVVGLWMTELFGIRDPWMLDRAAALGHAMQLTNILRDVGEDLEAGRLYLPTDWLREHGLERSDLERMARTGRVEEGYRALLERLMAAAEAEYDRAFPAIARLPDFYRRPVAVAAEVYRGIHHAIRDNGFDNLTRRAHTRPGTKLRLGAGALLRSRRPALGRAAVRAAAMLGVGAILLVGPAGLGAQQTSGTADREAVALERVEARAPSTAADRSLTALGRLWIQAVDDEASVHAGLDAVDRLESGRDPLPPARGRLLRAYRGSFTALLAKHGGWPRERLRNLREGFALMDAVVAEAPDAADLRYIRLMSGFYLPGVFGRGQEVEADLRALVRLLPDARDRFPPALFPEVVRFVLENGEPATGDRARLEALLR